MSIPKTNSPTSWLKAVSLVKNGTIFSVFSKLWTIQFVLAAMSATLTTLEPCRRGKCRKENKEEKISACLHNQNGRGIWCWTLSIGLQQRWVRAHLTARWISQQNVQFRIHAVEGNLSRWIRKWTAHQVLKWGTQILSRAPSQGYLLRDWQRTPLVQVCFGHVARQSRVYGESLLIRTTETWSPGRRRIGADQHQRNDLRIIDVCVREGSGTSRKRLWRKSAYYQELGFRQDQTFVQHHAAIDPWSRTWNIWNIHDCLG